MFSILIPIYNYPISNLIVSLNKVATGLDLDYEILCLEDGSTSYLEENKATCDLYNSTTHHISIKNKGRITSRKYLAQNAKYNWLLFLDADVEIIDKNFIKNYSNYFAHSFDALYGGCSYDSTMPDSSKILRWTYGKTYEDVEAKIRNKNPYKFIVSANFLIRKKTFQDLMSKINNDGYGYDIFIGAKMMLEKTEVFHIDNPVIHKGLDDSSVFLSKVELAVETLFHYYVANKNTNSQNSLLEVFKTINRIGLKGLVNFIFKRSKNAVQRQLLGNKPNMKLLQFYKLGYLCTLSDNKE
ncbi:glycosyltransferase family A protein [Winogradskyella sp.]|uniref:glycosyltransferase family 2 protein n=1 Tax=Winogradskyella sp. TaxID=1883156 RepID=UPI002619B538|nr:glycosyltransferase family A protein [Winogradskyella sp.]